MKCLINTGKNSYKQEALFRIFNIKKKQTEKEKVCRMIFKDRGILIKIEKTGESSAHLTLLTQNNGKVRVYGRGSLNVNSKYNAGSLYFAYAEYSFYQDKGFCSLMDANILHTFLAIRRDYDAFSAGCLFLEMSQVFILENMDAKNAVELLLYALRALDSNTNPNLVTAAFIFKFLRLEGYAPFLGGCSVCGSVDGDAYFCSDGIVCKNCAKSSYSPINSITISAIEYILKSPPPKVFGFSASTDIIAELKTFAILFLRLNTDVDLKTLQQI